MPPLQKASQIRSTWLRSSPVSTEAAAAGGPLLEGALAPRWRTHSGGFQPSARAPWLLSRPHRRNSVLRVLKQGIAELSGSPASRSMATRIWSFVIRLPSSGISADTTSKKLIACRGSWG
jgi:predicted AAA+ superfamily ATPase